VEMIEVPIYEVASPAGAYFEVGWLPTAKFIVQYESVARPLGIHPDPWTYRLWKLPVYGGELEPIELPENPEACLRTEFGMRQILQNGSVVVLQRCVRSDQPLGPIVKHLLVWDSTSGAAERRLNYQLPSDIGAISFHPSLQHGIFTTWTYIKDQMYWFDDTRYEPIDVGMGRANRAAWSPIGDQIVFWGNRHLDGPSGPGWAGQPNDLWLIPAGCVQAGECADAAEKLRASGDRQARPTCRHACRTPGRRRSAPPLRRQSAGMRRTVPPTGPWRASYCPPCVVRSAQRSAIVPRPAEGRAVEPIVGSMGNYSQTAQRWSARNPGFFRDFSEIRARRVWSLALLRGSTEADR
jgi:hypothetical protein